LGIASRDGAELAVEQINENGGILGKRIELISYDDQSLPEQAVKVVTRLIEVDEVHTIVGSLHSGNVLATGPICEEAQIPQVGVGTSPVWLEQGWTYLFRPLPNTSVAGSTIVKAATTLELSKMVIFHSQDEYGKVGMENMVDMAEANDIEVLGIESFKPGDVDFTGQFVKLISLEPDVFYIIGVGNELGPIMKQLREKGYEGYTIGDNAFSSPDIKEIAGTAADKIIFAAPYIIPAVIEDESTPKIKQFLIDYMERYQKMVETDCAFRTYDAVYIFEEAIGNAGSLEGPAIRDAIENITDLEGLAGTLNFKGNNGEGIKEMRTFIILDGKDVLLEEYLK